MKALDVTGTIPLSAPSLLNKDGTFLFSCTMPTPSQPRLHRITKNRTREAPTPQTAANIPADIGALRELGTKKDLAMGSRLWVNTVIPKQQVCPDCFL